MTDEFIDGEVVDDPNLPALANALPVSQPADLDVNIKTAHQYPRSIKRFMADAAAMATYNQEIAQDFNYHAPIGKQKVGGVWKEVFADGPSIRAAEICALTWQNNVAGWRPVAVRAETIEVEGFFHDFETNTISRSPVIESIMGKPYDGNPPKRYSDRQIMRVMQGAGSKAKRNAVFSVIPRALVDIIARDAMECAMGRSKGLVQSRAEVIGRMKQVCADRGAIITDQQVCSIVGKMEVLDLNWDDVRFLIQKGTSVRDGVIPIETLFPAAGESGSKPDSWKDTNPPPKSKKQREREALDAPPERVERAAAPPAPKADRAHEPPSTPPQGLYTGPEPQAPYTGPTDEEVEIFKDLWEKATHGDGTPIFSADHLKGIIRENDCDVAKIKKFIAKHRQDQP
jgi:hypothetical protein